MVMGIGAINERMRKLPEWTLEGEVIIRLKIFGTYGAARDFVMGVSDLAENMNHRPVIVWKNHSVKIILTTPEIGGVGERDFDMAEEIERLL